MVKKDVTKSLATSDVAKKTEGKEPSPSISILFNRGVGEPSEESDWPNKVANKPPKCWNAVCAAKGHAWKTEAMID